VREHWSSEIEPKPLNCQALTAIEGSGIEQSERDLFSVDGKIESLTLKMEINSWKVQSDLTQHSAG
jgi:hypothetical protein